MRFSVHYSPARIAAVRDVSPTVRLIEIAPEGGTIAWTPGAHLNLSLPIGSGVDTRSYSLVGTPDPHVYRIAVKRDPNGRGGSAYMHDCAVGARLSVSEPHNHFSLSWQAPHYVLVAGGIGVTPIHSMALALARRGEKATLLQAARTRDELAFADEMQAALGADARFFVSDEGTRIDAAMRKSIFADRCPWSMLSARRGARRVGRCRGCAARPSAPAERSRQSPSACACRRLASRSKCRPISP
jgi:ferredoxin-NADP reductase